MTIYDMVFFVLVGILIAKKIPMTKTGWKKWYYNRRGILFYVCHLLDNGSLIKTTIVKDDSNSYSYDDGKYMLFSKGDESSYVPYINLSGLRLVFHNKNNINPLVFKQNSIEPGYNDPQVFESFIKNKDIHDTLRSDDERFSDLRRYILIIFLICILSITAIVWIIFKGGF